MAYYYLTDDYVIYKTVGARYVKLINRLSFEKDLTELLADNMAKEILYEIDNNIIQSLLNIACSTNMAKGVIYTPYIPLITTKIRKPRIIKKRNRISIQNFRKQNKILYETNDFQRILFELSMKEL